MFTTHPPFVTDMVFKGSNLMAKRPNLRKHDRSVSAFNVEIGWAEENGDPKSSFCQCKNVGVGGFRVVSRDPIPLRSYVQFRFTPVNFHGSASVRNVRQVAIGYEIGLEFSGSELLELERLNLLATVPLVKQIAP
jgi:hypothetical protein